MTIHELLNRFCRKDNIQVCLKNPIVDPLGGMVYASDGRIAIRVKLYDATRYGVEMGDNDERSGVANSIDRFIEAGDTKRFDKKGADQYKVSGLDFEKLVVRLAGAANRARREVRERCLRDNYNHVLFNRDDEICDVDATIDEEARVVIGGLTFNAKYIALVFKAWAELNPVGAERVQLECEYHVDGKVGPCVWFGWPGCDIVIMGFRKYGYDGTPIDYAKEYAATVINAGSWEVAKEVQG